MMSMLQIDGSQGEGGGQILRSSLALSLLTGQPFVLDRIRANRAKPGLMRQHLTCVLAAQRIGNAYVEGAELRSPRLRFEPGPVAAGEYRFAIGTAGSTTLVLQTVLPALLTASGPSSVVVEGGTHNDLAPPFEFLAHTWLPQINRLGCHLTATLERHGFHPAGGGRIRVDVTPAPGGVLTPFRLDDRGLLGRISARVLLAHLSPMIAEREAAELANRLQVPPAAVQVETIAEASGPGNALLITANCEHLTMVFGGVGRTGVSAEKVATDAARAVQTWLASGSPVDEHLADQLLLPLALAGGGGFVSGPLSLHAQTNMAVVREFLPHIHFAVEALERRQVRVTVRRDASA